MMNGDDLFQTLGGTQSQPIGGPGDVAGAVTAFQQRPAIFAAYGFGQVFAGGGAVQNPGHLTGRGRIGQLPPAKFLPQRFRQRVFGLILPGVGVDPRLHPPDSRLILLQRLAHQVTQPLPVSRAIHFDNPGGFSGQSAVHKVAGVFPVAKGHVLHNGLPHRRYLGRRFNHSFAAGLGQPGVP